MGTVKNQKNKKNRTKKHSKNELKTNKIKISSNFESGNIKVKSITKDSNNKYEANLEINKEPYNKQTPKKQRRYENWMYFRADNVKDKDIKFRINNIAVVSNDWEKFQIAFSYDNKNWKRLPTKVNQKKRTIKWDVTPTKGTIWFAYYPPYPFSRSRKLLPNMKTIGRTKDGNPMLMTTLGTGPIKVWLISGQHPGETIHSWILEGFVRRIKEIGAEKRNKLFEKYTFYIVPNANPDGNQRGNWYVTSQGINMNRDWLKGKTKSPEVKAIKTQLAKYGHYLVFDIHGDEGATGHFLTSGHSYTHPQERELNKQLNKRNKYFQLRDHYKRLTYNPAKTSLDDFTNGITVEGAMKHPIFNHKTLQDEPIQIGKSFVDIFMNLFK